MREHRDRRLGGPGLHRLRRAHGPLLAASGLIVAAGAGAVVAARRRRTTA
ncbi:hypothetical protein [Streptomyces sp. 2131.1]|nr:hypothetical protein [Streptomyces sp. 2131.1]